MRIATSLGCTTLLLISISATAGFGQDQKSKTSADLVEQIMKATDRKSFYPAYSELRGSAKAGPPGNPLRDWS